MNFQSGFGVALHVIRVEVGNHVFIDWELGYSPRSITFHEWNPPAQSLNHDVQ